MTSVELCNVALAHLGEARIAALAEDTATARACNLHYLPTLHEVLRSHRWNFAIKRAALTTTYTTITGAVTAGGLIEITKATHGLATGTRINLKDVGGVTNAIGQWLVTSTGANTFTLNDSLFAGTYTSGGSFVVIPAFAWDFRHALPADCLRVLECNDSEVGDWISEEWLIEGRDLLTGTETVNLVYVRSLTADEDLTDPLFSQAFGLKLAVALTETIRGSTGKTGELLGAYQSITAPQARRVDANEGRRRKGMLALNSRFIRARSSGA